jgi:hypothetical protein
MDEEIRRKKLSIMQVKDVRLGHHVCCYRAIGMPVAWVAGSEPKPLDIVTATAAYATVLVVFYGNVISGA